jgi:hypothetical protein
MSDMLSPGSILRIELPVVHNNGEIWRATADDLIFVVKLEPIGNDEFLFEYFSLDDDMERVAAVLQTTDDKTRFRVKRNNYFNLQLWVLEKLV